MVRENTGLDVTDIIPMEGGNLSRVFSFRQAGKGFVIKFSDLDGAYATERFIADLLSGQGIPFPRCIGQGKAGSLYYSISERVAGGNLIQCSAEEKRRQLPELMRLLTRMNHVEIGDSSGYGWIRSDGEGTYPTWRDYILDFFSEHQKGTFWEGWYDLFETTCLERDVFDECYARLIAYCPYNEPHRHFIHGDFHPWNIISDGRRITGIIDGNFAYGDFLVDLVTLRGTLGELDVVQAYRNYQEQAGIEIPNFEERLLGAQYFKGLDALRFYAKMGWTDAYRQLRTILLELSE
ncbi:phosphotransferase family protein [Paenibacillus sp. HJGM_3]|uniref:phosphotransferase family protein n=1 Tax=Paenibacillus sp. HJGM_3 TaxID=3379816 RepID=UPI00385E5233